MHRSEPFAHFPPCLLKAVGLAVLGLLVLSACTRQVQPQPDVLIIEPPSAVSVYGPEVLSLRSPALEHFGADPGDYAWRYHGADRMPAWRACMHGGRFGERICRPGWIVPELPRNDRGEDPEDPASVQARDELSRLLSVDHDADEITGNRYRLHLRQLRFAAHEAGLNARQIAALTEANVPWQTSRRPGVATAADRRIEEVRQPSGNAGTQQAVDRAAAIRSAGFDKGGDARITPIARDSSPD